MSELADHLVRAVHLLALCLAPRTLSPDPARATSTHGLLAAVALAALLIAAVRFRRALGSKLAGVAAGALFAAVAAALGASLWTHGQGGPLGRAVPFVGPLLWGALALAATAAADQLWLKNVRVKAAVIPAGLVLAFGGGLLLDARSLLGSPDAMWRRALDIEPTHERALLGVAAPLAARSDHKQVLELAAQCIEERRDVCVCHGLQALALLRLRKIEEGRKQVEATMGFCGDHPLVIATHAHALALAGAHQQALAEVKRARKLGAPMGERGLLTSELHFAEALALESAGQRTEAQAAAERAVHAGGGRDAQLLAAAVAIGAEQLDVATGHLDAILAIDPEDVDAVYNRALVAHKRDDYNGAREGYLKTLQLAPAYAEARYNLVVLTWHKGVKAEARYHAQKFSQDYPNDPRRSKLMAMVAAAPRPSPRDRPSPQGAGPR